MIKSGNYGSVDGHVTNEKDFPIRGVGTIRYQLTFTRYNYNVTLEELCRLMKDEGHVASPIEDLLTFKATYPNSIELFDPVIAAGSRALLFGFLEAPCILRREMGGHDLVLYGLDGRHRTDNCSFLARKVSVAQN